MLLKFVLHCLLLRGRLQRVHEHVARAARLCCDVSCVVAQCCDCRVVVAVPLCRLGCASRRGVGALAFCWARWRVFAGCRLQRQVATHVGGVVASKRMAASVAHNALQLVLHASDHVGGWHAVANESCFWQRRHRTVVNAAIAVVAAVTVMHATVVAASTGDEDSIHVTVVSHTVLATSYTVFNGSSGY